MEKQYDFLIVSRYLVSGIGWQKDEVKLHCTSERIYLEATARARQLDADYGDDHFWTVDIKNQTFGGAGVYQFFHGRTS